MNRQPRPRHTLFSLVFVALLGGCGDDTPPENEPSIRPVRVFTVSDDRQQRSRTFSGIAQSTQESRMSFRVSGTLTELPVQVGDQLQTGDLIARLNPTTFDLTVQQSDASLAQALANERNAEANYTRVKELYENTNASRNDLDSARANAESARAQVRSAQKALEIAELNRSYAELSAASQCTVARIDVEINENVNSGSTVASVNCGSGIEVSIDVPESLIGGLSQGMAATVRFDALPNTVINATVSELGSSAAGTSVTFPVVVTLSEPVAAVRPGMAADVAFSFASNPAPTAANAGTSVRVIPAAAVINDPQGTYVYLAVPEGNGNAKIQRRSVQVGELIAGGIEVTQGLSSGDLVVTAGISVIRPDQIVQLQ
ncbi:MAG: efflux RND transporter periplasmic adaptor subunit [Lysobacterales bacterium]